MAAVSTGHVVSNIDLIPEGKRGDYRPIPPELQEDANRALAGKLETVVDVKGSTRLAGWMHEERAKDKRAVKAKKRKAAIAKASRRRNRGR